MSVNGTCTLVDLVPAASTRDGGRVGGSVCVERAGEVFRNPFPTDSVHDNPN